jgi:putative nucleotidyltransferase with HDIG domain
LQEFSRACPGTYAHSLSVGCLASAAAEEIDADGILCRVAAYYHDIGKMRRAEFFVENQSGYNVHDNLNPSLSALIVTAHVKQGLMIAEEAKLPLAIRDIIAQHHGTSLIRYFYYQASEGIEASISGGAFEQQFRYPGPKPQTVEAGIMMLADAVEAASRVLERPTQPRIEELVHRLVDEKLAEGQLDEAPLRLKDLTLIKAAFVRVLSGMLHSRVEYPEIQHGDAEVLPTQLPLVREVARPRPTKATRAGSLRGKMRRSPGKLSDDECRVTPGNGFEKSGEPIFVASFGSDASSHAPGPQ